MRGPATLSKLTTAPPGAAEKDIETKEALCALFADADGHPKKLEASAFAGICRDSLGVDLEGQEDDGADDDEAPLVSFVKCFASDDDAGLVDVGELLWKLLLWPGAEEEHRSLVAGRALRQDLLTAAEESGLETVGDLCAAVVGRCKAAAEGDDAPADEANDKAAAPLGVVLHVLREDFRVSGAEDLAMYPPPRAENLARQVLNCARHFKRTASAFRRREYQRSSFARRS